MKWSQLILRLTFFKAVTKFSQLVANLRPDFFFYFRALDHCTGITEVIPEGWGDLRKNPLCGRGFDIFWNYKIEQHGQPKYVCNDSS